MLVKKKTRKVAMVLNIQKLKETSALITQPIAAAIGAGVVMALGHSFSFFMSTALWHGSLFCFLQSAIAYQLSQRLSSRNVFANYLISHLVIGTALYGLSLLAFKVGLIASFLTLPVAVTLMTFTAMMGFVATVCGNCLIERFKTETKIW